EMVIDKPLTNVKDIDKTVILDNVGLTNLGPARVKCALLALKVMKLGMVNYLASNDPESAKILEDDTKSL
ncbi:MAG: Fe-S cluster protein, partial [Nitrososphaeraceae archaeon]